MATPTKKGSKTTKAKPPRGGVKTSPAKRGQTIAELRQELEARNRDLAALYDVTAAASQSLEIKPVLDEVVKKITEIFAFDSGVIYLFDPQREYLNSVASFGTPPLPRAFRRGQGLTGRVAETGEPILFENVQTDPRYQELSQSKTAQQRDYCFFAIFPIKSKQRFLGTINCSGKQPRQLVAEEIRLIRSMCDQIGVAVENINLFEEVRNKTGELESSNSELRVALEQQTATSEILGVIASSPTDIQPVLDAVARSAARLCESYDAVIHRVDGDHMQRVAHFGPVPVADSRRLIGRGLPMGRAIVDAQTIHVHDVLAEVGNDFPDAKDLQQKTGTRTVLAIPLLRKGVAIGVINVRRTEVRPFSENQIALLKTFADQAVIAIENVRLFKELGERNAELHEALEHQTATSEVLGIISRSPTDVQPVLDAIVESAARVCGIDDVHLRLRAGNMMISRAHFGPIPIVHAELATDEPNFRWVDEHGTLHIPDVHAMQNEFPMVGASGEFSSFLSAPLRQQDQLIGTLSARRTELRPFTPAQIKLLETFADQAVIALENVRLFQELKESLEQQTATSTILGVIASSPTDIQPVLNAVAESAARLCDALDASIYRIDGDSVQPVAHCGPVPLGQAHRPLARGLPVGRAVLDRQTVHIHDLAAVLETEFPDAKPLQRQVGARTCLATPLLREGVAIGAILIRRTEVRPFSEKQIALLKTFAAQAVIAIENVRLFKELQERNAELREALEHQTATAEVLGIISRSPTDVQPVLDAIVESAARVCGIDDVVLRLIENDATVPRAHFGPIPIGLPISTRAPHYQWMRDHGALHIPDARAQNEFPVIGSAPSPPGLWGAVLASMPGRGGTWRTYLGAPLRQQGELIGVLNARRVEVRPFTPAQIKLLETFADQAVIAIENVRLFQELQVRNRDLTEALEQQTATSEILRVIASSPTDIQPVLDVVAENAARLCEALNALIYRVDGESLKLVAKHGPVPAPAEVLPISRGLPTGRAVVDRQTIHVRDLAAERTEFPESQSLAFQQLTGTRTILATPLLREGLPIGVITIRRQEIRPFADTQVNLLKTFADQAVIAIENVRLFKEIQERNAELREALEHQTATAEVLGIISRSPTDVQPVLDAIVESAARVCGIDDLVLRLREGDTLVFRAHFGSLPIPIARGEISVHEPQHRWMRDHGTLHVPDTRSQDDFPKLGSISGWRTFLGVPLRQQGEFIGGLFGRRTEVRPFTPAQIKLLETFADQAVIAIENVRLFNELKESLEQQTATSEILGVIARSPTDVQPVLDVVAENAARLCDATDAQIVRLDGDVLRRVAAYGSMPTPYDVSEARRAARGHVGGRAVIDRKTVHVHDVTAEFDTEFPQSKELQGRTGARTILATPLLREDVAIGAIVIRRTEVRPFTDKQIALLKTFADQAVIAIENVRLFQELQIRNRDLTEALEQQTATSEVLKVISRSTFDLRPVLETLTENAVRLCGADMGSIYRFDGERLNHALSYNATPELIEFLDRNPIAPGRYSVAARAALERQTIHVPDVLADPDFTFGAAQLETVRTVLGVPMIRGDDLVGVFSIRNSKVQPFTDKQIELVTTFADQAVIAIENVRLFNELQERTRELMESVEEMKALGEVGQAVSSTLDLQTVLSTIVRHAVQLSGTNGGVIYEYDEAAQEFHLRASDRMEKEVIEALQTTPIRPGQGATGQTVSARAPVQVFDLLAEREIGGTRIRPIMARLGYRSLLAVPLLREERIMGALTVWRKEVGNFSPEIVNLLQTFATQSALAIQNARLFREIENKSREIETANRHKSEFLANMSHELRTPLTAIIGFSEVLSEKVFGELNDKQSEYMDDIVSSGRHLLSLINDILDLSKVEAGRMELDLTKFDMPTAIDNALILIRERATRHGITLRHTLDERLGEVLGDERKFKQILLNLLSNAVKFTAEGGSIDVDAALTNGAVEVSVSDTGIGIAPENQEAIFEEFRQVGTDVSKKREGTGLGLTLTRKFVELHGGKIWVESAVGKGSTFTFTLPLQPREV